MTDSGKLTNDDLFVDINVRSDREIRARVRILDAICHRIGIERAILEDSVEAAAAQEERFDSLAAVSEQTVSPELSLAEREFLETETGRIDSELLDEFSTCQESLLALATALSSSAFLPPAPLLADSDQTIEQIQQFIYSVSTGAKLTIPSDVELEELREYLELWQWRAFIEADKRDDTANHLKINNEFEEVLDEVREAGLQDLAIDQALADSLAMATGWSGEELAEFELAVTGRLHAINWLCGLGERWDSPEGYV
jgi:hypothetical protein